jgi:hypothetical protein
LVLFRAAKQRGFVLIPVRHQRTLRQRLDPELSAELIAAGTRVRMIARVAGQSLLDPTPATSIRPGGSDTNLRASAALPA